MVTLNKNQSNNVGAWKSKNNAKHCKRIRGVLASFLGKHFSPDSPWIQNHIANCPRCQKRFAAIGKVNLALSFIKSQSHNLNLLMRANTQTINVLKHSLREVPSAQKLKIKCPELNLLQRFTQCLQPSMNMIICVLVLVLMKFGIFSSVDKFQTQGRKAYKQYFVNRVGEDLTEEIFPDDIKNKA